MTPTIAIAAPPAQPPLLRPSEISALRAAIVRCGPPVDAGTVEQFCEGVYRAGRELERVEAIWHRYQRRFGLLGPEIGSAPVRLQARHCVVRQIAEQRSEFSRMLIRDPIAGSA